MLHELYYWPGIQGRGDTCGSHSRKAMLRIAIRRELDLVVI